MKFFKSGALASLALLSFSCTRQEKILVFHAGSLSPLFDRMAERFQKDHPGVIVYSEASGSLDALRKITELGKPCDLVASADRRLLQRFLVPRFASSVFEFLGNELVLAAAKESLLPAYGPPTGTAWYERLATGKYSYGISDPDRDPAGYFSLLAWKLAEGHYQRPGLYRRLWEGLDQRWIRPRSSELVALLQTENLDFAFLYKSTALQNDLPFLLLSPEVALGESAYAEAYSRVFVQVAGGNPGSRFEVRGAPIRYGVCVLNDAHPLARRFLDYLLSAEAQEIYRGLGFMPVPIQEFTP